MAISKFAVETFSLSNLGTDIPLWKCEVLLHLALHRASSDISWSEVKPSPHKEWGCYICHILLDGDSSVHKDDLWGQNLPKCHPMHQACYRLPSYQDSISTGRNFFYTTFVILIQLEAVCQEILYCYFIKILCELCLWSC